MKHILVVLICIMMSSCGMFRGKEYEAPAPVTVVTQQIPVVIYQPALPIELSLESVEWLVITQSNSEQQFEKISKMQSNDPVIFAVTPQGYENLSYNLQELRRYIKQLREIVTYYQEVTKTKIPVDAP